MGSPLKRLSPCPQRTKSCSFHRLSNTAQLRYLAQSNPLSKDNCEYLGKPCNLALFWQMPHAQARPVVQHVGTERALGRYLNREAHTSTQVQSCMQRWTDGRTEGGTEERMDAVRESVCVHIHVFGRMHAQTDRRRWKTDGCVTRYVQTLRIGAL